MLGGWGGNCRPGGKYWQPTTGFMASVTCRLTVVCRLLHTEIGKITILTECDGSAPEPYTRFEYWTTFTTELQKKLLTLSLH